MKIIKVQEKILKLNIALETIEYPAEEKNKKQTIVINSKNGRIVLGENPNQNNGQKINYTIDLNVSINGFLEIKNQKEILTELKIHILNNVIINRIQNGIITGYISLSEEQKQENKTLFIEIIKNIVSQYKTSFEFFKRIREDSKYFIKFEIGENKELLEFAKNAFLGKEEEEAPSLP